MHAMASFCLVRPSMTRRIIRPSVAFARRHLVGHFLLGQRSVKKMALVFIAVALCGCIEVKNFGGFWAEAQVDSELVGHPKKEVYPTR